jgi:tetratricopeptide (TPR) repeat protein
VLFDLRSRGRRRTVQVIYLGLAVLIGGGLVLFGVGAGNGTGGLLNGLTGNGSGSAQNSAVSQATKAAEKAVKTDPGSPSAWANLVQADWTNSQQSPELNATTGVYTTRGKQDLTAATGAWQHYLQLTKSPTVSVSILAARAYEQLGQYSGAGSVWEYVIQADPKSAKGYECLAMNAYAAKQTRKAELAATQATRLVPQLQRLSLKQELSSAKTQPALAKEC